MIQLPADLSIERNDLEEVRFLGQARTWLASQDKARLPGIHASDLLDPLKAYWQWADPKPHTDRQVFFFLIGKVLHHFVLASADPDTAKEASGSGPKEALGIIFEPDLDREGYPTELKTNRSQREPNDLQKEYHHYLEQLSIYMVLKNVLSGALWILYINLKAPDNRTYPELRCYRVQMTEEQFYELEQEILKTRDLLAEAKETRNPSELPLCREWLCGDNCAWFQTCKPSGRWPDTRRSKWTM